jgi:hypothetical protein
MNKMIRGRTWVPGGTEEGHYIEKIKMYLSPCVVFINTLVRLSKLVGLTTQIWISMTRPNLTMLRMRQVSIMFFMNLEGLSLYHTYQKFHRFL